MIYQTVGIITGYRMGSRSSIIDKGMISLFAITSRLALGLIFFLVQRKLGENLLDREDDHFLPYSVKVQTV
jgi:hypothetical protein